MAGHAPKGASGAPKVSLPSPGQAPAAATPAKAKPVGVGDGFDVHSARSILAGPTVAGAVSVPGVGESFPVGDLSKIGGRGLSGDSFLLDGGAMEGMKLQIRRVRGQGGDGFEIVARLQGPAADRVRAALQKGGGTPGPLNFPAGRLGVDGVAELEERSGTVTEDSTYSPSDMSSDDQSWVLSGRGRSGGTVSIVGDDAAHAARNLLRIRLTGDDKACTAQLADLSKRFGLAHLFAPPTAVAKQRQLRASALWQADHEAGRGVLDKLDKAKLGDLDAKLKKAHFSAKRIDALRFSDVSPTHFAPIDPEQAERMMDAGACYLYSTVQSPEHVLSILQAGQKSSLRRYEDGLIVDGMSTNEDFSSGGAVGVFTRVVTQGAIGNGESWTGRRYKIILRPEVLARTDWFGWDEDRFGQAWGLKTKDNFGEGLLARIDDHGSYASDNELIFRDSIGPQYIGQVVATSASDRQALIDSLRDAGYAPPDGRSLEELVLLAPEFMPWGGKAPVATDAKKNAAELVTKAADGNPGPALWFLARGEPAEARGALQLALLGHENSGVHQVLLRWLNKHPKLDVDGPAVEALLAKHEKKKDGDYEDPVGSALFEAGAAFLALDHEPLAKRVAAISDHSWRDPLDKASASVALQVLAQLLPKPGGASKALAVERLLAPLLHKSDRGAIALLQTWPQLTPKSPSAFVKAAVAKLSKQAATTELRMFCAQAKQPEDLAEVQLALLGLGNERSAELLAGQLELHGRFGAPPAAVSKAILALPESSPLRKRLFASLQLHVARLAQPKLMAALDARFGKSGTDRMAPKDWVGLIEGWKAEGRDPDDKAMGWALARSTRVLLAAQPPERSWLRSQLEARTLELPADVAKWARGHAGKLEGAQADVARLELLTGLVRAPAAKRSEIAGALLDRGDAASLDLLSFWSSTEPGGHAVPLGLDALSARVVALGEDPKKHRDALRWIAERAGPALLERGEAKAVAALAALHGDYGASAIGLAGSSWATVFARVQGGKGTAAARDFLWQKFARPALERGDGVAAATFRSLELSPDALGLDDAERTKILQRRLEDRMSDYDSYDHEPAWMIDGSIRWLLGKADGSIDAERVRALVREIPNWAADGHGYHDDWSLVLDALASLPGSYTKVIGAARKKLEALD